MEEEAVNETATAVAVVAALLEVARVSVASIVTGKEIVSTRELAVFDAEVVELLVGGREERGGRNGVRMREQGENRSLIADREKRGPLAMLRHTVKVKVVWQNKTLVTGPSGGAAVGGKGSLTVGRSAREALSTAGGGRSQSWSSERWEQE